MEFAGKPNLKNLPKVLLLRPPPVFTIYEPEFSQHFDCIKAYESPLPLPHFLTTANSAGVTAMIASGHTQITGVDILDHLPNLRCIVTTTAGLNYIDLAECRRRGIAVSSAGDSYSDDCAESAVALLIDVLRNVSSGDRFVRIGGWSVDGQFRLGNRVISSLILACIFSNLHQCNSKLKIASVIKDF